MEDKLYTNNELSQDYFSVVVQYSGDWTTYNTQKKIIAEVDINLHTFYLEHERSLNKLQVKGIGEKTKGILELILNEGIEEARRLIREKRIDGMRQYGFRGIPSKVPRIEDDTPPSWDDAVKRYEEY